MTDITGYLHATLTAGKCIYVQDKDLTLVESGDAVKGRQEDGMEKEMVTRQMVQRGKVQWEELPALIAEGAKKGRVPWSGSKMVVDEIQSLMAERDALAKRQEFINAAIARRVKGLFPVLPEL